MLFEPVICALFPVVDGVFVVGDDCELAIVLALLNPVAATDPALIVPVHADPTGQQATWPAWSRAHIAFDLQHAPTPPKLAHEMKPEPQMF